MRAVPLLGLLSGFIVVLFDVILTLLFEGDAWTQALAARDLHFDPTTPIFFIFVNLIGGYVAFWLFDLLARANGNRYTVSYAMLAVVVIWGISRLYLVGFLTSGLMPVELYIMFSIGLFMGYMVAVIICREILLKYKKQPV